MSHYPPPGGPPPYQGYPYPPHPHHPPPHPGSFTYVPAPVMMPVYPPTMMPPADPQPPPTYVTNHIYPQPQTQPEPIQIAETAAPEMLDWAPATTTSAANLVNRALVAGKEGWDGSPLWVIRAHHSGEFVPGKLAIKHRSAYIPYSGKEVPVHNFEVLCAPPHAVRWVPGSNGRVPAGAVAAGNTHSAEPLYIGRVRHRGSICPGKIHPSHGCCYISFADSEIPFKEYEVLCRA